MSDIGQPELIPAHFRNTTPQFWNCWCPSLFRSRAYLPILQEVLVRAEFRKQELTQIRIGYGAQIGVERDEPEIVRVNLGAEPELDSGAISAVPIYNMQESGPEPYDWLYFCFSISKRFRSTVLEDARPEKTIA